MTKASNTSYIVTIGVLIVVFFTLLVMSSGNKNVNVEYKFEDNVEITNLGGYDNTKLGTVKISNGNFLPTRVKLKNLKVCNYEDLSYSYGFDVYYTDSYRGNEVFNGYYNNAVDVSMKTDKEIAIYTGLSPIVYDKGFDNKVNFTKDYDLYIFDTQNQEYRGDFCVNTKPEDALKYIKLKINITK